MNDAEFGKIKPMLCKLRTNAFNDPDWIFERKYDGIRILAFVDEGGSYRLQARSGTDKTAQFPELKFDCKAAMVLDGEITAAGKMSFQEFAQRRMNRSENIATTAAELPAMYHVFDLLALNDRSVEDYNLHARQALLSGYLRQSSNVTVVQGTKDGVALFKLAKERGWEGVVGKSLRSPYRRGRRDWVKVKVWQEGEFDVKGAVDGQGKRSGLVGAFLLCDDSGRHVGNIGTGFTDAELRRLTRKFRGAEKLRFKVKYVEITNDGMLRFPVYMGEA